MISRYGLIYLDLNKLLIMSEKSNSLFKEELYISEFVYDFKNQEVLKQTYEIDEDFVFTQIELILRNGCININSPLFVYEEVIKYFPRKFTNHQIKLMLL